MLALEVERPFVQPLQVRCPVNVLVGLGPDGYEESGFLTHDALTPGRADPCGGVSAWPVSGGWGSDAARCAWRVLGGLWVRQLASPLQDLCDPDAPFSPSPCRNDVPAGPRKRGR